MGQFTNRRGQIVFDLIAPSRRTSSTSATLTARSAMGITAST